MPRKIEKLLYTYEELIEAAKDPKSGVKSKAVERAKDKLREWAVDDEWWDLTVQDWKQALEQLGFNEADIQFSGFASQGDGASFTCKSIDFQKLLAHLKSPPEPNQSYDSEKTGPWIEYKVKDYTTYGFDKALPEEALDNVSGKIERTRFYHYVHENTCEVELDLNYVPEELDETFRELRAAIESYRLALSKAIYKDLEVDYFALQEDENLNDMAAANDYTFDAYGNHEQAPSEQE